MALQKPIFKSSIGRWKTILSQKEVDIIDSKLGDISRTLGY